MQMLHAGGLAVLTDQQRRPDEDNPRGYFEFEPVTHLKKNHNWLADAQGKVVKIVHLLMTELPTHHEYRVIFMRRDLTEVVRSQQIMLERSGKRGGGLPADRLIQIFQTQLAAVSNWLSERPCFCVLNIEYADLIRNPRQMSETMNEFLNGSLNVDAMEKAVDPTLYRNRG